MTNYLKGIVYCFLAILSLSAQTDLKVADDLYALGNYSKAIIAYKAVENSHSVYDKIAKSYSAIGNFKEAINYYEKALAIDGENLLLKYNYAKLLKRIKKFDKAQTLFTELTVKDSLNPNFHYELGLVLEQQNDTLAIEQFRGAYTLDPSHQKAIFKIAKKHIVKRQFEEAHQLIDKGLASYSENVELISLKAQAYYFQEYYTHAVVWFKKLLELGESSEFIHEKLSLSYAQNSDYKEAIFHRKEALKFNPYDANAVFVIGSYYERLAHYEKAEEYYTKSLQIQDVPLSNEYQKLGGVLNRQKKYKEAIVAYQKALDEDPSDFMSEFFLIRTKEEYFADKETVIKLYQNFIEKHKDNPFSALAQRQLDKLKEETFLQKN